MAYPPRQFHEGYWYHVYTRQQRGAPLFYNDDDRRFFMKIFSDKLDRQYAELGAYCLMTNHYHALVKMGGVSLDRIFQGIHSKYARYFNDNHSGDGNLFKDRPGMKIVLEDSYCLQLVPYIHQNPEKAGMVDDPRDYQWHSGNRYRGGEPQFEIDCWKFPPNFQGDNRTAVYKEVMGEPVTEHDWEGGEAYIGSEKKWENMERRKAGRKGNMYEDKRERPTKQEIAQAVINEKQWSVEDLKSPGKDEPRAQLRQKAMVRMYDEGYGPTEIGRFFNRSKGAVSYAVENYET